MHYIFINNFVLYCFGAIKRSRILAICLEEIRMKADSTIHTLLTNTYYTPIYYSWLSLIIFLVGPDTHVCIHYYYDVCFLNEYNIGYNLLIEIRLYSAVMVIG